MNKTIKRNSKTLIFTMLFMLISFSAIAGNKVVKIKTSAICGMCKNRIELAVNNLEGVKKSILNTETGIITIKFDAKLLTEMDIRKTISDTGYDADDLPKSISAYNVLPGCCKTRGSCASKQ